jgi:hypothetical protein
MITVVRILMHKLCLCAFLPEGHGDSRRGRYENVAILIFTGAALGISYSRGRYAMELQSNIRIGRRLISPACVATHAHRPTMFQEAGHWSRRDNHLL